MFWFQTGLSFLVWVLLGIAALRFKPPFLASLQSLPRGARCVIAATALVFAVVVLFGSMTIVVAGGGLGKDRLGFGFWLFITLAGAIFMLLQAVAMSLLGSLAVEATVTARAAAASTCKDSIES